ncbi:MAG TPA: hypothetical protein VNE62_04140 [Actinomycetota bacterium]|nr:hypothetical protein [Actinomycetota bacterium]
MTSTNRNLALVLVVLLVTGGCGNDRTRPPRQRVSVTPSGTASELAEQSPANPANASPAAKKDGTKARATQRPAMPTGPLPTPAPFAKEKVRERITLEQALEWWPHRPVLRVGTAPKPGGEEAWFATSKDGGRKGDPNKEYTILTLVLQYPPDTAETKTYYQITDAGGATISMRFFPPGLPPKTPGGKQVLVRNRPATMWELYKQPHPEKTAWREFADQDIRAVNWSEALPNDRGHVDWIVEMNPRLYSEEQTLEFVNSLVEAS